MHPSHTHLHTVLSRIFFCILVLIPLSGFTQSCFSPDELNSIKLDINTLVDGSLSCQSDDDCIALDASCELGCDKAINRNAMPVALDALAAYQQLLCTPCSKACSSDRLAVCISGQCQITILATEANTDPAELRETTIPSYNLDSNQTTASSTPASLNSAPPSGSKFGHSKFATPNTRSLSTGNYSTATSTIQIKTNRTATSTPQ